MSKKQDIREMTPVLSAEQYFDKYARNGIAKGMDRILVKNQLIDAFRKEIFGLITMRAKKQFDDIPPDDDPEALRIARNVIKDTMNKWKKLVAMFEMYRETSGLLTVDDLKVDAEAKEEPDIPEDAVVTEEDETGEPIIANGGVY